MAKPVICRKRRKYKPMESGDKYGRLTAVEYQYTRRTAWNNAQRMWLFLCECGKHKIAVELLVASGKSKSCGCLRVMANKRLWTTHGMRNHRLYDIWGAMMQRCHSPNSPNYKRYGKRGIRVCTEWRKDRVAFFKWALVNGYADSLSIERVNNNKGYSPSNCKWATSKEQNNNRRDNRFLLWDGHRLTISQWGIRTGFGDAVIRARLAAGWGVKATLTLPKMKGKAFRLRS